MRASGINRAFMQARSLSAGPVIAASSAAGMPSGSEGNAQLASGVCAVALPASAPARIVATNSVGRMCKKNADIAHRPLRNAQAKGACTVDQNRRDGPANGEGALRLFKCRSKYTSAALNNIIHDE